jgi:Chlorophyll A-B binding protein
MKFSLFIAFAGSTAAFAPAPHGGMSLTWLSADFSFLLRLQLNPSCHLLNPVITTSLSAEKSPAVPFLPYPENVRGYVGDYTGFDPLRFSDYFPMDYLREAELKHCRLAMLAITGFVATDIGIKLPFAAGVSSADAHTFAVEQGALGPIAILAAVFEMTSWISIQEMLQGSGREPGYFGFGSSFLDKKSPAEVEQFKIKELSNGRLAMFAIGGAATQSILTGHGFPYV